MVVFWFTFRCYYDVDQPTNQSINIVIVFFFVECTCLESLHINNLKMTPQNHDQSVVNYHTSYYTYYSPFIVITVNQIYTLLRIP